MTALLASAAVAPESSSAAAQDPPGADTVTDEGALPPTLSSRWPASTWPSDPRGTRQEIGFALHTTTFWSREASHYTFYSLGLAYLRSSGSWGPFVHAAGFLPLQARQDGRVFAASGVYGRRIGGDLLVGWQKRWHPSSATEAELGPGVHVSMLWMPGATGYRDFSAMPLGLGLEGALRWHTGLHVGRSTLRMGQFLNASLDFYDPLRSNDLRNGFTVLVGVMFGLDDG